MPCNSVFTSYVCQVTDLYSLKRGICSEYWCLPLRERKEGREEGGEGGRKEWKEKGEGGRKRGRKSANDTRKGTCTSLVVSLCISGFRKVDIIVLLHRSSGGLRHLPRSGSW